MKRLIPLLFTAFTLCLRAAETAPALAAPFGDNMVLQRGMPVPVWGSAAPGATIEVAFAGQTKSVTADGTGSWLLKLDPLEASAENRVLSVSAGGQQVQFKNVLVGEVWIGSGQSNMEMGVGMCQDAEKEFAAANDPLLRVRAVNKVLAPMPTTAMPTATPWLADSPDAIRTSGGWGGFSGTAYFFARKLRQELKVPVGMVQSAWGGTLIEPWTPPEGFAMVPSLKSFSEWLSKVDGDYRSSVATNLPALTEFARAARVALDNHKPLPLPPPAITYPINGPGQASALYNGHIHPWVPFAIRGALWYQGESNLGAGDTGIYVDKMQALVGGWRKVWGQGDFPFYFVQLAPFRYKQPDNRLPEFWEAQTKAAELIPNCGMAVINEIGDFGDIHPKNKQEVGRRLALLALARTYGMKLPADCGPQFASFAVKGRVLEVKFSHAAGGLRSRDGKPLVGFEIAGENDEFVPATATAKGDTVVLQSEQVAAPTQARYAWSQCPVLNAVNSEDLPLNSFRTPGPVNLALHASYTTSNPNTHGWGATGQLTDGSWAEDAQHCFATDEDKEFPKDQVVDLGKVHEISRIKVGVPNFGSTKTIVVSLSTDGKEFIETGRHEFSQNKTQTAILKLAPQAARYVKLTAPDHHEVVVQFPNTFVFLTELEVFGK